MKNFKHSGTLGDIVYGLALMKHFGGGNFYLHLGQVDWIGQHYYGTPPAEYHKGRMNHKDLDFMREFFLSQPYIHKFEALDPKTTEITHNLDRFRPLFVGHPSNYVNTYCMSFGINDPEIQAQISNGPWLSVPNPQKITNKPIVVNRTSRGWAPKERNPQWDQWKTQGLDTQSIFVGLPDEYEEFCKFSNWNIEYRPVKNMLELAEIIAGCEKFIGNQSVALSIAQGLRVPYIFERRRDLPIERNESYFPNHLNGDNF